MNIFIGSFFVILILGAICKKICNGKKMFCIGSGTIYFLVAALRSSYVGGDSFNYRRMFELLADKNIKFAFAYSEKDPIFNVLLSLLGKVTDNYSVLFAIVAVLFTITVWVYIYKYSDDPVLSVIVLLAFNLYQFSLTGMRQTIAISFVVLAIMAVHEEKKIQPYIWVLIASLFHSSALVCLSIPILSKIRISTIAIRIAPIPLMICFIFRNSIAGMLVGLMSERGYGIDLSASGYTMMLVIFILYLIVALFVEEYAYFDKKYYISYMLLIVAVFFETLVTAQNIFFRIAFYFLIVLITVVPNVAERAINKNSRKILKVVLYVVLSVQYLFYTVGSCNVLPYNTFWQI